MKKMIITLNLILVTLFISGCGCNRKNKNLECNSEFDEYNEKKYVEAFFEDNYLKKQTIRITTKFENETLAKRFYDMYADSDTYDASIEGLEVNLEQIVETNSTDEIFKYDKFYDSMLESGFKCKKK